MQEQNQKITKQIIEDIVIKSAAETFFVEISNIERKSRIDEDLSADGISLLDYLDNIENKLLNHSLSIAIAKDIFTDVDTIGELSDSLWNEVVAIVGEE